MNASTDDDFTADRHADLDVGEFGTMSDAEFYDRTAETVTHDAYCCMNGIAPSAGPLPGCPGIDALNERYAEAKFENDCAADLDERWGE